MTIKDYEFKYEGGTSGGYTEEVQSSHMRWCPLTVDHSSKEMVAERYPFQCREFLIDMVFWWAGNEGEMYGMSFNTPPEKDKDYSYIALMTDCPDEASVLDELCEFSVDCNKVAISDLKDVSWDDDDMVVKYCYVIQVPKYARTSPVGMSLWSMGIRGHVENKTVTPDKYGFGIPQSDGGNNEEILDCIYHGPDGDLLPKLWTHKRKYLWHIDPDEEYTIGECTHEMFSPGTLTSNLDSEVRYNRFMDMIEEDNMIDYDYYQIPQLELLRVMLKS